MVERILVVDDDPVQRRLLQSMLARNGYDVVIAEGGDAAAAMLTGAERRRHRRGGARPGDAGSRRPRRARARPRRRTDRAGDRADRAWRHRQCRIGDARGRDRLRGQAGRRRAPGGEPAQRARHQGAGERNSTDQAQPCRHADLQGHHHPQPAHARGAAAGREGGGLGDPGADRGPLGRRQGADRPRHPRHRRTARAGPSSRSIAAPSPTISSNRSCSATRRAPSPARPNAIPASSSRPTAARCSSTRSASFRWPRRSSCCARSRKARSSRSARASR